MKLWIDFETYSEVDIKKAGAFKYIDSPTFKPLLLAFAVDNEDVRVLDLEESAKLPVELLSLFNDPTVSIYARNATFEYLVLHEMGHVLRPARFVDTASLCAYYGWPRALDKCAKAMGTTYQKSSEGSRLIKKFCCPNKHGRRTPMYEYPLERKAFMRYNALDVYADRECVSRLPSETLPFGEKVLWCATLDINKRGVPVDMPLARQAVRLIRAAKTDLDAEITELTGGAVTSATQVARLKDWLITQGVCLPSLDKRVLADMDMSILPPVAVRAIEIRQAISNTSVAKFQRMREMEIDGRVYGTLIHYGAHTGRWAGRGVQFHNLSRQQYDNPEAVANDVMCLTYEQLKDKYGPTHAMLQKLVRAAVKPKSGWLVAADLSSIENVVLHWCARDTDTVNDFFNGIDQYKRFASRRYMKEYDDVTDQERKQCKPAVLGLGFGAGYNGLIKAARQFGVILDEDKAKAEVNFYRNYYKRIVAFWNACHNAAVEAILFNEKRYVELSDGKKLMFYTLETFDKYLVISLPSGRELYYPSVRYSRDSGISYMGGDAWLRVSTHRGMIVENIVQALARDILGHGTERVLNEGLRVLFTLHDEIVIEAEDPEMAVTQLVNCMTHKPRWAAGMPVNAVGFYAPRYKKG